ncbi:MAG: 16S rRNA processing protein RimM [Clostridiales bacterium GWB2_37_7]|nr:MAG: 16S rRNA processing protein RimM [Clostridiales bacterium GWB2_37_7]
MLEYLSIGQIVNTHGIRGELKVYPLTDDAARFDKLKEVYIESKGVMTKYQVESSKHLKNTVILKLKGIDTMNDAEKLRQLYLKVGRWDAVRLPKDAFFVCDIVDSEVYDIHGVLLGKLYDVLQTGSNDVYVVKTEDKDLLIPALKSVVKEINLQSRKIIVDLPEGLI